MAMVQAAPNRADAECLVLAGPRPVPETGQVEFEVELRAANDIPGTRNMLGSQVGQRITVRGRPEFLPAIQPGQVVRLFLEMTGPGMPVQARPTAGP